MFFIAGLVFLTIYPHLESVMLALIGGAVIGLGASWLMLKRYLIAPLRFSHRGSSSLFKQAAPLAASLVIVSITMALPQVILSIFRPFHEVGLFSAAYNLITPIIIIAMAFSAALLPTLSGYVQSPRQSLNQFHELVIAYIFILGLPLTAGLALFSSDVIEILYGSEFAAAAPALVILSFDVLPFFMAMYFYTILIAFGAQHLYLLVTLCNLGLILIVNILLVPSLGFIGSSIGVLATGVLAAVLMAFFTARWVTHRLNRRSFAAIAATCMMASGVLLLGSAALWLRVLLAFSLYALGLWITGGLKIEELKRLVAALFSHSVESDL